MKTHLFYKVKKDLICFSFLISLSANCLALPSGFTHLHDISPNILEDIRYAGENNFLGEEVPGYLAPKCILTKKAAEQLHQVELEVEKKGYHLKVYDCYRPQMAVNAFIHWSQDLDDKRMKKQYYPSVRKASLFQKGYIAKYSGHSRGSTVDLTLVKQGQTHSIDMGTRFDFFDRSSRAFYSGLTLEQRHNRLLLRRLMIKHGFKPYNKEWWHFTLKNEPYPKNYFNFKVR